MKIHFLLAKDFFRGGGIETYTREVGRRLAARGHDVTVYSTRGSGACPENWEGMRLLWLPRVKPYWAEKCSGALVAAVKALGQERPDVMHLHSVVAGCVAPLLRHRASAFVLQMHGIEWMRSRWSLPARSVLKTMERTSLVCADALTAVSQAQCDYFKEHYSADCEYIPTAAEMKPFAPASLITQLGLRPQEYVLYAARLVPEKGLHYLIRAFRRVPTSQTLVIAGEAPATGGYEQEIRKLAGDDPRIRFVGRVEGRLLQELFSNTTLFVQPSELEGLSIGLIEAMSYGAACLASDIPENQEVVADAGILFRSKDVNDLEQQLRWSLASPAVLRDRAAVGKARALNLFSWDRVVDQLESLYDRTLERVASNRGEAVLRHPAVNPNVLPE